MQEKARQSLPAKLSWKLLSQKNSQIPSNVRPRPSRRKSPNVILKASHAVEELNVHLILSAIVHFDFRLGI
jgi:hypothetical protein